MSADISQSRRHQTVAFCHRRVREPGIYINGDTKNTGIFAYQSQWKLFRGRCLGDNLHRFVGQLGCDQDLFDAKIVGIAVNNSHFTISLVTS
jgi:hypothetical protein